MQLRTSIYILLLSTLISCQPQTNRSNHGTVSVKVDESIPSLYPLGEKWLELQNLEFTNQIDTTRNFKKTAAYKNNLKNDVYKKWCEKGDCYLFNDFNELVKNQQSGQNSTVRTSDLQNYFFPIADGFITVTSLPTENILTIKKVDKDLQELWRTIYEKSRLDSVLQPIQYANLLGYNDNVMVFNSNSPIVSKSGYIELSDGSKRQEETQWSNILLDEDNTTVLGQIVQSDNSGYSIKMGDITSSLPDSLNRYKLCNTLISKNKVFLAFHSSNVGQIQVLALDYHTAKILWERTLDLKASQALFLSSFAKTFMIEASHKLSVLNKENGEVINQF